MIGAKLESLAAPARTRFLFEGAEWDFVTVRRVYDAIERIACEELGLDVFPNQIEIISAEQMLDAYCSIGMPLMYGHWSFGKRFVQHEALYRRGYQALAYEIVINSNPCISYYMEENTAAMQTLVLAHAAFGHNHFYKNNYLFKQWTDPDGVLDYLDFSKKYVAECEERHGAAAVEATLDAAHALMNQGVFRYKRRAKLKMGEYERRRRERSAYEEQTYSDLWRTVPQQPEKPAPPMTEQEALARKRRLNLPEENILYFIEKNSPILHEWQRELLRIVRNMAQYFYPQRQTKLMNEGCATFVHYCIVNRLFDKGLISEGALLEILHSHSNVTFQPEFDDPSYGGVNPYALGFAMMQDIERISIAPTAEDRDWFPDIAGNGDWLGTLKDVWANYRDESFVRQYLSPHLMRKMRFFALSDKAAETRFRVDAIHDDNGYRSLRNAIADSYDLSESAPDIQVADVDLLGDRRLILRHYMRRGVGLATASRDRVLNHVRRLWGYDVHLQEYDAESEKPARA
jgi:stage V sporulation protein R